MYSYLSFCNVQLRRYEDALEYAPRTGQGFHPYILKIASHGVLAGQTDEQMLRDIRAIVRGPRHVPESEILDAIKKARQSHDPDHESPVDLPRRRSFYAATLLPRGQRISTVRDLTRDYSGISEEDIRELSPIPLTGDPVQNALLMLEHQFHPNDILFIGDRTQPGLPGKTIRTAEEWQHLFDWLGLVHLPYIIPNPVSGQQGLSRSGTITYRGDSCICDFKVAVVEFDDIPRDLQLAFLASVDLPICALIDSGGKSIHAWVRVDGVKDESSWDRTVRENLFGKYMIPLGADPACQNQARLSRMPGHFRKEKQRYQSLLYLAPQGRRVLA